MPTRNLHSTMAHIHNDTVIYRNDASIFHLPFLLLSANRSVFVVYGAVGVLAFFPFVVR